MDSSRSRNAMKKGKDIDDTKRDPNWTVEETNHLLDAVVQIHEKYDKVGFNFKDSEVTELFDLFMVKLPRTTRKKEKMVFRLKVLQKMYKVCHELASRSGGGWDDETHRPIAPSEEEYVEMVRAKGESAKFLLQNNFPWYRQIEGMVGGQSAKGVGSDPSWAAKEPIPCLLTARMSIQCSQQDSSDDADEGNQNDDSSVGGPSRYMGRQNSYQSTWNSGSKRKSTDDSSEHSSKGKRYKERARKKKVEDDRLADAGFELARILEQETKWKMAKDLEVQQCIARFKEFGIVDFEHDFCMSYMNVDSRRKWFLDNDKNEIIKWIKRTTELSFQPTPPPMNFSSFFTNPHPNR